MSFNPNVPLANDSPSQDQPIMLANSQIMSTAWEQDHPPYGSSTNVGFSKQLTLIKQSAAVSANTTNGRLFSMPDAAGVAQLYWRAASADGAGIQQLTANVPSGGGGSGASSGYVAYTQTVGSTTVTIQQWYWILAGSLQVKLITMSSVPSGYPFLITYLGTGSTTAPFASQPIIGYFSSSQSLTPALGAALSMGISSAALPSTPTANAVTAYLTGVNMGISGGSPSLLIFGI